MKANIIDLSKNYSNIPQTWGAIFNYDLDIEKHFSDGWRDVVTPDFNPDTQKLSDSWELVDDIVTKQVIDLTTDEIEAIENQKKRTAINSIYDLVEKLENSALRRALNKPDIINRNHLDRLKSVYDIKYQVSLEVLADTTATNTAMFNVIDSEKELEDFAGQRLYDTINYLNATFNANITPLNNRLKDFCQIIKWKYEVNSVLYNDFISKIEKMRSVLITDAEFNHWTIFNQRVEIVNEIIDGNNMSVSDIQTKYDEFINLV
jgi:hypothetical protein